MKCDKRDKLRTDIFYTFCTYTACASMTLALAQTMGCSRTPRESQGSSGSSNASGSSGSRSNQKVDAPRVEVSTPPARAAYITNNGSDSISVIDRDGPTVTDVPIAADPARGRAWGTHPAPHHLAVDPTSGALFVALAHAPVPGAEAAASKNDPHAAHGRASTAGQIARFALGNWGPYTAQDVDDNPGDIVLTHDRARALVTHFDMKRAMTAAAAGGPPASLYATLQIWDTRTLERIGSRAICVAPHGVVTTRDDRTAIVACYGSDELALVDLTAPGLPTSRYPLGPTQGVLGAPRYGPYSALLSPDEREIIVANLEGTDVRIFDRERRRFLPERTLSLGARVFMSDYTGGNVILAPLQSPDGVARIDIARSAVEKRVTFPRETCQAPHAIRRANDGRVYLVCEGDHVNKGSVLQLDPETLAVVRRWAVGVYPDGIAFGE
ncbi:YncE family protein [Pendulispora albinea]|uniref:Uncharacterized protein n=1 Tax=Pendulispora albinea TaxID=2741071 RepID=A0ABZ2M692_9BACT